MELLASLGCNPFIVRDPCDKGVMPVIALNSVDFPPPLGPTTATNFPSVIEKVTSSRASASPY